MREIRKIYRAQYLRKLQEVVIEERSKQQTLMKAENEEKQNRRSSYIQKFNNSKRRAAILKDRLRIDATVTETIELTRRSRVKKRLMAWLSHVQQNSSPSSFDKLELKLKEDERNISAPQLLAQLGRGNDAVTKTTQPKRRITKADNVFQDVLEESYNILPEDEGRFQDDGSSEETSLTARQRAQMAYANFSESEKFRLLDSKIEMLQSKLDRDEMVGRGDSQAIYRDLLDRLSAVRLAYLESKTQRDEMTKAIAKRDDEP
eukprot:TRINITY_DN63478_c0_g1_i2.p1 TRINITY_DN63478_c0_g1~~TRINITY_DN63478_c0_g1_i2.p1  ORF type:complete len:261 (-),score=33.59 TRINITY_DN63478_c0_g1_i2:15-797(-)